MCAAAESPRVDRVRVKLATAMGGSLSPTCRRRGPQDKDEDGSNGGASSQLRKGAACWRQAGTWLRAQAGTNYAGARGRMPILSPVVVGGQRLQQRGGTAPNPRKSGWDVSFRRWSRKMRSLKLNHRTLADSSVHSTPPLTVSPPSRPPSPSSSATFSATPGSSGTPAHSPARPPARVLDISTFARGRRTLHPTA